MANSSLDLVGHLAQLCGHLTVKCTLTLTVIKVKKQNSIHQVSQMSNCVVFITLITLKLLTMNVASDYFDGQIIRQYTVLGHICGLAQMA
jgi:hypothetical protein